MYVIFAKINIPIANSVLFNPIEYLKGVGPLRADLLKKELGIFTFRDLLEHFPFRHIDRTHIQQIAGITPQTEYVQVAGRIHSIELMGEKRGKRLVVEIGDSSGVLELVWFQGINWVQKALTVGKEYIVFGKAGFFQGMPQITHPEMEELTHGKQDGKPFLEPVYPTTEKLKAKGLGGRQIANLVHALFIMLQESDIPENLPGDIRSSLQLTSRFNAYTHIHFPPDSHLYEQALNRLKFEEFFLAQIRIGMIRAQRHRYSKGVVFEKVGDLFNIFYKHHLPFALTGAQKRVLKEIRKDTAFGKQMNRLLQGDVGSGKTVVALLSILLAIDNGYQGCLMAPTEILARQHFNNISELLTGLPLCVRLLTGSTKSKDKKEILQSAEEGVLHLLIGTHALIEDKVQFSKLGIAIVDEQHRFGVAQRARLWAKSVVPPHVLVMTATPIPRTLAMTAYGDLDYSVIDELPPGRQQVATVHRYEQSRAQVMDFIKTEVKEGRQAYIIFPLIEESQKMDYENLMRGYENVKAYFPEPAYWISMVHGRQKSDVKDTNMQRFVNHDTQIMVSTTVVEVGVNVPNATVMVVESAEKFGLSQLHQLRGRVGRGSDKSYCILLTGKQLTREARERLNILCATNDGFKIAEKDLEIRGPGDIEGTRQSGILNFKLASLVHDKYWLDLSKEMAERILHEDPALDQTVHLPLKLFLQSQKSKTAWSKIS
ncbi:MAG: ATP-dependent DNA helicase RecG [Chitinophagaceae bacterium]